MYGVVLWSDVLENKAVFWCEDQGDLAFYHAAPENEGAGLSLFDAGDLVQFDVYIENKLRKASNPRVVREKASVDLPERLLNRNDPLIPSAQIAQVVPFRPVANQWREKAAHRAGLTA